MIALHPTSLLILAITGLTLLIAPALIALKTRGGSMPHAMKRELWQRYASWLIIAPAIILPIILGRVPTIIAEALLSMLCLREFSRATGFFRERLLMLTVLLGIALMTFASLDNWYNFFVAVPSLTMCLIVIVGLQPDQPKSYIQRVAMAVFAFLLFGMGLGHLGFFANDRLAQPILLLILFCVELNDVFAFLCGKAFGRRKLSPRTSPGKTVGGALGALILTPLVFALLGSQVFKGTPIAHPIHLISMGVLLSICGQFGDLVLSSIKRDLGIKDMDNTLPGHGGFLDRFDSLLLVAPVLFHYIGYFSDIGLDIPIRVITN